MCTNHSGMDRAVKVEDVNCLRPALGLDRQAWNVFLLKAFGPLVGTHHALHIFSSVMYESQWYG